MSGAVQQWQLRRGNRMAILVKIRGLVWRGVEFWPFPLTCFVTFKTLWHSRILIFEETDIGNISL